MIKTKHNCPICCFNSVTIGSWCWGNELINSRVKNKHCVVSVTHTTDWFDNGPAIITKIWSSFDNICTKLIRVTPFNHILGNITLIIIRFCTNCYLFLLHHHLLQYEKYLVYCKKIFEVLWGRACCQCRTGMLQMQHAAHNYQDEQMYDCSDPSVRALPWYRHAHGCKHTEIWRVILHSVGDGSWSRLDVNIMGDTNKWMKCKSINDKNFNTFNFGNIFLHRYTHKNISVIVRALHVKYLTFSIYWFALLSWRK